MNDKSNIVTVNQLVLDGWEGIDSDLEYSLTEMGIVYRRISDNEIEFLIGYGDNDVFYHNIICRNTYLDILYHHVTDNMLLILGVTREEMNDFSGMNIYDMNTVVNVFVFPYPWEYDEFYTLEREDENEL